jgi:hypothetical protein
VGCLFWRYLQGVVAEDWKRIRQVVVEVCDRAGSDLRHGDEAVVEPAQATQEGYGGILETAATAESGAPSPGIDSGAENSDGCRGRLNKIVSLLEGFGFIVESEQQESGVSGCADSDFFHFLPREAGLHFVYARRPSSARLKDAVRGAFTALL